MIGPLLGAGLFSLFGYKAPWIIYGTLMLVVNAVFFLIYMKKEEMELAKS